MIIEIFEIQKKFITGEYCATVRLDDNACVTSIFRAAELRTAKNFKKFRLRLRELRHEKRKQFYRMIFE